LTITWAQRKQRPICFVFYYRLSIGLGAHIRAIWARLAGLAGLRDLPIPARISRTRPTSGSRAPWPNYGWPVPDCDAKMRGAELCL
jgi:hypothetical protein